MSGLTRGESVAVIADARLTGIDRHDPFGDDPVDLHLAGGIVTDIAPAGALPRRGAVVSADGGFAMPGLWDHHVHTVQWAMLAQREPLLPAESAAHAITIMAHAPLLPDGRRVGSGFRDALWPDSPTRAALDAATGGIPTYMINADVHSVWLNSAAFAREGIAPTEDGILREGPAFEVSRRLNAVDPLVGDQLVDQALRRAAERGVVGITDMDMAWNAEAWHRRLGGQKPLTRVRFAVYPDLLERALAEGWSTGDSVDPEGLVQMGPLKVISDGSLGTRTAACSHGYAGDPHNHGVLTVPADELVRLLTRAAGGGIASAVHAIGDIANSAVLDAFATSGAWGTIEHAQLVAHRDFVRFARLDVGASVQPEHALDDRDLSDREWADQTAMSYPLRSLHDAGANLLFGSDAPVAVLDPWAAISAAVTRTRDGRAPWHPEEAVSAGVALAASTERGSQSGFALEPGDTADVIVTEYDPLADPARLRDMPVSATVVAGRIAHLS